MCWITLSPKEPKGGHHHHHHRHRHPHMHHVHFHHDGYHGRGSSVEHLVRRDRISIDDRVRIVTPAPVDTRWHHRDHHWVDMHPLRLHPVPVKLHGPGKKRAPAPVRAPLSVPAPAPIRVPAPVRQPAPVPAEGRPSSRCSSDATSKDAIYRIQPIYERAAPREIQETTRIALREVRPQRTRLRRVAGYDILSRQVPWSWDAISRSSK